MTVDNVWPYLPESGYTETYEHLTDVLRTYSSEQRINLRKEPRLTIEQTHLLSQEQYAQAKLKARRYGQSGTMQVPIWGSQKKFPSITSGQTVLDFGSEYVLYYQYVKEQNVIIWKDWNDYVVRSISSTTPNTITLSSSVGSDYANAFVMPLRTAVNYTGFPSTEDSTNQTYVTSSFTMKESSEVFMYFLYDLYTLDDIYSVTNIYERSFDGSYNGKYVQATAPYRVSSVQDNITQPVNVIDNGFGPLVAEAQFDYVNNIQSVESFFQTPTEKAERVRDLFGHMKGRLKSFYLPTYNQDIILSSGTYSGTTLNIEPYGIGDDYEGRDIMIEEADGTLTYRNITSATSTELTLDSSVSIDSSTVSRICFLNLVRYDVDTFTITHGFGGAGTMQVNVIEVPS